VHVVDLEVKRAGLDDQLGQLSPHEHLAERLARVAEPLGAGGDVEAVELPPSKVSGQGQPRLRR
jgi:hypothetical protein